MPLTVHPGCRGPIARGSWGPDARALENRRDRGQHQESESIRQTGFPRVARRVASSPEARGNLKGGVRGWNGGRHESKRERWVKVKESSREPLYTHKDWVADHWLCGWPLPKSSARLPDKVIQVCFRCQTSQSLLFRQPKVNGQMKKGQTFAWILGSERTGVRLEAVKHIRRVSARRFEGNWAKLKAMGDLRVEDVTTLLNMGTFCTVRITLGYRHRGYQLTSSLYTIDGFTIYTPWKNPAKAQIPTTLIHKTDLVIFPCFTTSNSRTN